MEKCYGCWACYNTTYLKNLTNNKEIDWQQTYLILPDNAPEKWHLYPEEKTFYCKDNISLSEIMKLSIGVFLKATKEN